MCGAKHRMQQDIHQSGIDVVQQVSTGLIFNCRNIVKGRFSTGMLQIIHDEFIEITVKNILFLRKISQITVLEQSANEFYGEADKQYPGGISIVFAVIQAAIDQTAGTGRIMIFLIFN